MPAVSGKRTVDGRSQHYKGPYNPIAGTLINNGPNLGPQPTSSQLRDLTPQAARNSNYEMNQINPTNRQSMPNLGS